MKLVDKKYFKRFGKHINWENPKTFTEKIQWSKFFDNDPRKSVMTDKYAVRAEVEPVLKKFGAHLIPLLGVWENFDDIDFSQLPDSFVLKTNHSCGANIFVNNKSAMNMALSKRKIDAWMSFSWAYNGTYQWHYDAIKPLILAE